MDAADASVTHMDDPSHHIDVEDSKVIGDISNLEDSLKSLTKAPVPSTLESQPGHSTKTRFGALNAKNLNTCKKTAQN